MITTENNGRLGNQIIRNLAFSLLAKKHDLKVKYSSRDLFRRLGIDLFSGINAYHTTRDLTEKNYFSIYNRDSVDFNLNPNRHYFQTKKITRVLHDYLHTDTVKSKIIKNNPFKLRYNKNADAFVHIRLTDAAHNNPGAQYYLKMIQSIHFENLYISTDDPKHQIVREILDAYPNAQLIQRDEVSTIQFGSTCKYVVLSHGSFSAVIGYLSFFSTVYYPEYDRRKIWYGDMFSIKNWIKILHVRTKKKNRTTLRRQAGANPEHRYRREPTLTAQAVEDLSSQVNKNGRKTLRTRVRTVK